VLCSISGVSMVVYTNSNTDQSSHQRKSDLATSRVTMVRHHLNLYHLSRVLIHYRLPLHQVLPAQPRGSSHKHLILTYTSPLREAGPRRWKMASHQVQVKLLTQCQSSSNPHQPLVSSIQPLRTCREDQRYLVSPDQTHFACSASKTQVQNNL